MIFVETSEAAVAWLEENKLSFLIPQPNTMLLTETLPTALADLMKPKKNACRGIKTCSRLS